jgi:hypothetical protein
MKKLAWIGIVLFALVILILAAAGITGAIFGGRYQAEIAAIRAKGEPVTPQDLVGPPIPPAENAALVYEQAFNALDDPSIEPQRKVLLTLNMRTAGPAKWREAEQALKRYDNVLALTEQAASMRRCAFEIDWSSDQTAVCPRYLPKMRSLARIPYIRARISARNGDMAQAVDDIDTMFGMAKSMEDLPLIIHQLVRIAVMSMATKAIEDVLRYGNITEAQARQLFETAGDIDVAQAFKRAWQGERAYVIYLYSPERFAQSAMSGGTGSVPKPVAGGLASLYSKTVMRGDLAVYLGIFARQVDGMHLSYQQARQSGLFDEPVTPFYAVLSKVGVASVIGPKRYTYEEILAQAQVFLALQAYKARYGGYPATMEELKSKLGWKLPVDPFSGKDFIYKKQAKVFILYSVGPDMKDDGGRSLGDHVQLDSKGDIVLKWDK